MQEYFFEKSFFDEFYLYNLGSQKCAPSHKYGPDSRENFVLHFIVAGKGDLYLGESHYELGVGDYFLVSPSEVVMYEANAENPWEYYWIGFNGQKVALILDYLKVNPQTHVGKVENKAIIINRFESILRMGLLAQTNKLTVQQHLFDILGAFHLDAYQGESKAEEKRRYSYSFMTHIKHHYGDYQLNISDIASIFGLNPSYFSQVIKSEIGMTPNEYLSTYRMEESRHLLDKSEKSVKEVSYLVGYENPLSFSRAFKKFHGMSPVSYREKHKKRAKLKNSDIKQ